MQSYGHMLPMPEKSEHPWKSRLFIYSFLPSAIIIHFLLLKGARLTVLETRTLYLSTMEEQRMQQLPYLPPCCLFIIYVAGTMKDQGPIVLVLFKFKRTYNSSSWRAQTGIIPIQWSDLAMVHLQDSFRAADLNHVSFTLTFGWRLLSDGNNFYLLFPSNPGGRGKI